MKRGIGVVGVGATGALLAALSLGLPCGGGGKSALIGDGSSISQKVGPAGGTLVLNEVTLAIPPGALATEQTITVVSTDDEPPTTIASLSPVFRFEPAGLQFAVPASVRFDGVGDATRAGIYWTDSGGAWAFIGGQREDGAVVGAINHFSDGVAGEEPAAGEEPTAASILEVLDNMLPKVIPCHRLPVGPAYSFPAPVVALYSDWNCPRGRCKPSVYARQTFVNIERQVYSPGEKVYYVPTLFRGASGTDSSYYAFYRAQKLVFSPSDPALVALGIETASVREAYPYISDEATVWDPDTLGGLNTPYMITNSLSPGYGRVVVEMCSRTSLPESGKATLNADEVRWFSQNGSNTVTYVGADIPTYLGYVRTVKDVLAGDIRLLSYAELGVNVVKDLTPIVGTRYKVLDCLRTPTALCWGEAAVSGVGDLGLVLGFGIPAKLRGALKLASDGRQLARQLDYVAIAGNLGLAEVYRERNEWGKALGAVVGSGVSVFALRISRAAQRFEVHDIDLKTQKVPCRAEPTEYAPKGARVTETPLEGNCSVVRLPIRTPTELVDDIAAGRLTSLNAADFPHLHSNPTFARQLQDLPPGKLEVAPSGGGSQMETDYDVAQNNLVVRIFQDGDHGKLHSEVALFHEIQDAFAIRHMTTGWDDRFGQFNFSPDAEQWLRSISLNHSDPAVAAAFKHYRDRFHLDILRKESKLASDDAGDYIRRGRLPPGWSNPPRIPMKDGPDVPVAEWESTIDTTLLNQVFTVIRERNSYQRQVGFYVSTNCERGRISTPFMEHVAEKDEATRAAIFESIIHDSKYVNYPEELLPLVNQAAFPPQFFPVP